MIVNTMDGNTALGFKPYTDRGALAHFIDGIQIGEARLIEEFHCRSGSVATHGNIRSKIHGIKSFAGIDLVTRTNPTGTIVVRIA